MYGYLRVDQGHGRGALAKPQCGLCAHFGATYRTRTRMLAGFDPSTLALWLDGLSPEAAARTRVRCPLTLMSRKRTALSPDWEPLADVAAVQLFLAGEKLFDDRVDRDGALSRVAAAALRKDIAQAENYLKEAGFPLDTVRASLRRQPSIEASVTADIDRLSEPTATALGAVSGWLATRVLPEDQAITAQAERFGDRLGRALYLVDALHDLRRDLRKGAFNPLISVIGRLTPSAMRFLEGVLEGRLDALDAAFKAMPIRRHAGPLHDATVGSLRQKGRLALRRLPAPPVAQLALQTTTQSGSTS
jgi:hypothetical protein